MPLDSGYMNFFQVNECGLYRNQDSASHGLGMTETFRAIYEWAAPRRLEDTIPWDPSNSRAGSPKMYCQDVYSDDEESGDFLFVLWKSDTDSTGTLWGAQQNATLGAGKVIKFGDEHKGDKIIWGRPCYYWVIPSEQMVVSIRFDHSVSDAYLFKEWISACIENRVEHPNKKREYTEGGLVRLSFTDGTDVASVRYRYGFSISLKTLSTSDAELTTLAKSVTGIVKRETIKVRAAKEESEGWVKLFGKTLGYLPPKPRTNVRQIEIRAEAKPSARDIREIIESHARHDRRRTDWENVGFVKDNGQVTWVDRYRIKSSIDVERDLQGTFSAAELYDAIRGNRKALIGTMRGSKQRRMA